MKKQAIDLLTCNDLSKKCFEPLIECYKREVSAQTDFSQFKEKFYKQLTEGQRALFMFYVYYNHVSKSLAEFYWWSAYFIAQPKTWSAIKKSIKYFKDDPLLLLLEKMELELQQYHPPDTLETFTVTREQLEQSKELQTAMNSLYIIFENIAPLSIRKINDCIKKNLQEFVEIEN